MIGSDEIETNNGSDVIKEGRKERRKEHRNRGREGGRKEGHIDRAIGCQTKTWQKVRKAYHSNMLLSNSSPNPSPFSFWDRVYMKHL
jgi:hypothetical protein